MKHSRLRPLLTLAACLLVIAACSKKESTKEESASEDAAPVDPEAPSVVIAMIDAHGGMPAWRTARTVSFESEFAGPEDSVPVVARITVDPHSRRAYVDLPNTNENMAWDGTKVWATNWSQPYPPKLALLDYYFAALPWLTMDPGVRLAVAGKDSLWDDATPYPVVRMSFARGTVGTAADSYRLYMDPGTKRLKAVRYTMSAMSDSVASSPEHIVVYDDFKTVDGLVVPTQYTLYRLDHSLIGTCRIRDWAFDRKFDVARMAMPDSAKAY